MPDEEQIRGLWRTMVKGWASGDAALFASVFADDVEFVTVRGEELFGREAVEAVHESLFGTVYRDTHLTAEAGLIRPLTEELFLVHATSTVAPAGIATHAQAVVARRDGAWSVIAFHNMIPFAAKGNTS
jgi:uncharacterized protein (TIGR02246 family)